MMEYDITECANDIIDVVMDYTIAPNNDLIVTNREDCLIEVKEIIEQFVKGKKEKQKNKKNA